MTNIDKDIQEEINKLIKTDNTKNKKILIFSGGGMKGLSLFGVLKALDELKILENIEIFKTILSLFNIDKQNDIEVILSD